MRCRATAGSILWIKRVTSYTSTRLKTKRSGVGKRASPASGWRVSPARQECSLREINLNQWRNHGINDAKSAGGAPYTSVGRSPRYWGGRTQRAGGPIYPSLNPKGNVPRIRSHTASGTHATHPETSAWRGAPPACRCNQSTRSNLPARRRTHRILAATQTSPTWATCS